MNRLKAKYEEALRKRARRMVELRENKMTLDEVAGALGVSRTLVWNTLDQVKRAKPGSLYADL